jgi:hypothetical protein
MSECGYVIAGTCTPPLPLAADCPMIAFGSARPCCNQMTHTCGVDATSMAMGCLDVAAFMGGTAQPCTGGGASGAPAAGSGAAAGSSGAAAGSGGRASGASGASGRSAGAGGTSGAAGIGRFGI